MDDILKELQSILSRLTPANRKAVLKRARRRLREQKQKAASAKGGSIIQRENSR